MPRFIIERDIPGIGSMSTEQLTSAAQRANDAVATLAPRLQWERSYLTADRLYCVYIADGEPAIREHAELAGVPADRISLVSRVVDPTNGGR